MKNRPLKKPNNRLRVLNLEAEVRALSVSHAEAQVALITRQERIVALVHEKEQLEHDAQQSAIRIDAFVESWSRLHNGRVFDCKQGVCAQFWGKISGNLKPFSGIGETVLAAIILAEEQKALAER